MVVLMAIVLYSKAEIVCPFTGNVSLLYQWVYVYNRPHLSTALSGREAVIGRVICLQKTQLEHYFIYECCHDIEGDMSVQQTTLEHYFF